jgi:hypothetical protein
LAGGWLTGCVGVMAAGVVVGVMAIGSAEAPPAAPPAGLVGAVVGRLPAVGASLPQPPRSAATIKLVAIPDLMTDSSR